MSHRTEHGDAASQVIALIASKSGLPIDQIRRSDRLLHDLGLYGDDAEELLLTMAEQFQVDLSALNFSRYFYSESFAFWILPGFVRRKAAAKKEALTVQQLIDAARSGYWNPPAPEGTRYGL